MRCTHLPRHPVSRVLSVILLLSMPLQGCSYRYVIGPTSPPQDYSRANDLLADHAVWLELSDPPAISRAKMVRVGPDSVSFMQGSGDQISIPAERFSNASYTNRWKGLGYGTSIGGLLGAILGGAASGSSGSGFGRIDLGNGPLILGTILGSVLGGSIGLAQGFPTTVIRVEQPVTDSPPRPHRPARRPLPAPRDSFMDVMASGECFWGWIY